jgi:hypothetical protein
MEISACGIQKNLWIWRKNIRKSDGLREEKKRSGADRHLLHSGLETRSETPTSAPKGLI